MDFTEEQKLAINKKNANILVQAAAGSGKTKVLVEKIVNLVCGIEEEDGIIKKIKPTSIDRILVMTFTKNATSEMKNRIKHALNEKIEVMQKNNEDIDDLEFQLSMINNSNIQTIDSFCKEVIDNNYHLLENIDPKYKVVDEKELELLKNDILDEILESYYGNEEYKYFFKCYFYKDDDVIKEMLNKGLNYVSSKAFPMQHLLDIKNNLLENNERAYKDFLRNKIENTKKEIKNNIDDLKNKLANLEDITPKVDNVNNWSVIKENIAIFGRHIEKIEKIYLDDSLSDEMFIDNIINFVNQIGKVEFVNTKGEYSEVTSKKNSIGVTLNKEDGSSEKFSVFKKTLSAFYINKASYMNMILNVYKNIQKITDEKINNKNEALYMNLLIEYYKKYEETKLNKKLLEIGDFQKYTLDLLYTKTDEGYVYSDFSKSLADKYDYIFVDEYQDTSIIQEKIVEALSLGYTKNNVFMVGDVKQNIYRFRNADITNFNKKYNEYKGNTDPNKYFISLSKNFRSCEEIIEFVNYVFLDVMTVESSNINYEVDNALTHGRNEDKIYEDENENEFYKNFDKKVEYNLLCGITANEIKKHIEQCIANKDNEGLLLYQNLKHTQITKSMHALETAKIVKDLHDNQNVPYKDIMILLRKNIFADYMDSFEKFGIPATCTMKEGFYGSYEINLSLDILSVIDNPYDDVKLASVLTSPIIDITNNDMAFIVNRYNQYKDSTKSIHFMLEDAIQYYINSYESGNFKENDNFIEKYNVDTKILYDKLKKYDVLFNYFRDIARYKTISDMINIICDKTNLINKLYDMPFGDMRVSNIKLLLNKAKSFESTSYVGLKNFINYLERIQKQEIDEGTANVHDDSEDIVHITTIHKSKGLEYKVVILPYLNGDYTDRSYTEGGNFTNPISFNDEYGVALNYVNYKNRIEYETPKKNLMDMIEKKESMAEEMRVLYVAMTRAREKLILIDKVSSEKMLREFVDDIENDTKLTTDEILNSNSYAKLINHTIKKLIRTKNDVLKYNVIHYAKLAVEDNETNNLDEEIKHVDLLNDVNIDILKEDNKQIDIYSKENLKKNEEYIDKYYFLTKIKPKISVSEIKSDAMPNANYNSKNKIIDLEQEDSITYDVKDDDDKFVNVLGSDIGNLYHRFMEIYDFKEEVGVALENMVNNKLIDSSAKELLDINKLKKFVDSDLGMRYKNAFLNNNLYREQRFMKYFKRKEIMKYKHDPTFISNDENVDIIVQGIIDAFFIEEIDGKKYINLVDYKTDGIKSNRITEDELINKYKVQLDIYKKALEETVGIEVKDVIIYSFTLDKMIEL